MISKKPDSIPFTKDAFEKMQKDYESAQKERAEILVRLQTAREMGDLSENGAYKYAKFELGNINRKLRTLGHNLRYGEVVAAKQDGKVNFGNKIKLNNELGEVEFTLVSEHESDPRKMKLSTKSPFGAAVLGKAVGESVEIVTPSGNKVYKITSIE